jgi:Asp-tRNA(Asn)/Glu-tRNA(Gln) amidotransferase A subunit family amidase
MDLHWQPATTLARLIRQKKVSPVEVLAAVLDRIDKLNPKLNAFVTLTIDQARREARAAERALTKRSAKLGPLHGVPFSVKDLVITKGVRTTFGTPLYRDNVPTEDAPSCARLKAAGGIMLGKTNTPTMGWIGATHNLLFGITRNPWNLDRTPAARAAAPRRRRRPARAAARRHRRRRLDPYPRLVHGIYGFKASYGRIPIHPVSGAWSLSHAGPMTRTVADAALMLNVCAGPDERDPVLLPAERVDYVQALRGSLKGLALAWTRRPRVRRLRGSRGGGGLRARGRAFRDLGCRVEEVTPRWPSPFEAWSRSSAAASPRALAPYLDRRAEIDAGPAPIIDGTLRNAPTKYVQAWFDRLAWWQHPRAFFEKYDLLLTPTIACPPFKVGLDNPTEIAGPSRRALRVASRSRTRSNCTGQPAASVPAGFTANGLPVGLQIVGRAASQISPCSEPPPHSSDCAPGPEHTPGI